MITSNEVTEWMNDLLKDASEIARVKSIEPYYVGIKIRLTYPLINEMRIDHAISNNHINANILVRRDLIRMSRKENSIHYTAPKPKRESYAQE